MKQFKSWRFTILFLMSLIVSGAFAAAHNESKIEKTPMDQIIEAVLGTGGTYAILLDDASYEEWASLMVHLGYYDHRTLAQIPLPLNVQFYGLAQKNKTTPIFSITPKKSGMLSVTVDTKGNFIPNIKCAEKATQKDIGFGIYRISFTAAAGKTYHITIGDQLHESGLYSITAVLN
ncbi:MAG: hypothetical protein LBP54_09035 [Campylobacteraceae bacterium]|nr:hypothetical protein [Campylobacteraceae bacterium]